MTLAVRLDEGPQIVREMKLRAFESRQRTFNATPKLHLPPIQRPHDTHERRWRIHRHYQGLERSNPSLPYEDIKAEFLTVCPLDWAEITSGSRKKKVVAWRGAIAYVLRFHTKMSLVAIGRKLGGKDHTTIHHAVNKVHDDRAANAVDVMTSENGMVFFVRDQGPRR